MSAILPFDGHTSSHGVPLHLAAARRVLVADDDTELATLLEFALRKSGFEVETVSNGNAALEAMQRSPFALLLLDIEMPELDGLKVCEQVRAFSSVPIIVLSARNHEDDVVEALDAGADGFVVKPFSPRALMARINALLRRVTETESSTAHASLCLKAGDYRLDIEDRLLHTTTQRVPLTRLEVVVLHLLLQNAGRPVHFKTLITEAWGSFSLGNRNMLKQVIFRLRRKLSADPRALQSLVTTGDGYCFYAYASDRRAVGVSNSTAGLY